MKTPSHWQTKNILSLALYPLGWLYTFATKLNIKFSTSKKVNCPVICIGNLTAGGTGKTPVAVSIASLLQTMGKKPFFVSRGYGGSLHNVVVNNQKHTAAQTGDEPLLLSRQAPVVVNPDRYQGAQTALHAGAELIIMDDGFQNPGLHKDLSFLVFDGNFGYGNGFGIPAGPLRENLTDGLKRAQAIIIIGADKHNLAEQFSGFPVIFGKITPRTTDITNHNIIAFAGIGRPEKFYQSLQEQGVNLLKTIDFPDHHNYTIAELQHLINEAKQSNAELYTTAKDYVKIPSQLRSEFHVLEIDIEWQNPELLTSILTQAIQK